MSDTVRPVPPPPPPAGPQPPAGTAEWGRWQLTHTFKSDDAAIIEWLCTWDSRHARQREYAMACHVRKWAGWQATLAWSVVEAITDVSFEDDDIPF